jgi:hypothetical protein
MRSKDEIYENFGAVVAPEYSKSDKITKFETFLYSMISSKVVKIYTFCVNLTHFGQNP